MKTDISISRKTDDPIALRASIGGKEGVGYYCVFRGNPADVVPMLEQVLEAMKRPEINFIKADEQK